MGMARPSSGGGARRGRTPARRARAHLPAAPRRSRGSRAPPPRPPGARARRPAPRAGPAWRRPEPPETPLPSRLRPAPEVRPGRSDSEIFTQGLGGATAPQGPEAGGVDPGPCEGHMERKTNPLLPPPVPVSVALT
ncbi:CASP-like protein 4A2 [Cervus elaphus]|uniref:CASP-like protein 4A2 n=1 Tax=Cervus elaphus TaxID=9860 RepID=UPI001CC27417|nr:CASP-like protein 4A2 [Cervus elaphus]